MPEDVLEQSRLRSLPLDTHDWGVEGRSFLSQEVVYFPSSSRDPENNHTKHPTLSDVVLSKPKPFNSNRKSFIFSFISNLRGYLNVLVEFSVLP